MILAPRAGAVKGFEHRKTLPREHQVRGEQDERQFDNEPLLGQDSGNGGDEHLIGEGPKLPPVLIGGRKADIVQDGVIAGQTTATVPLPPPAPAGPLDLAVITSAGQRVALAAALTVLPPTVTALDKSTARSDDDVSISGAWTRTNDLKPTVLVNGVTAGIKAEPKPGASLTFTIPHFPGPFSIDAKV